MTDFCETCDSHHKPTPPNPLPCGCAVKAIVVPNVLGTRMESHHMHVVHCPMHAAAERMVEFVMMCATGRLSLVPYEEARAILREIGR